MSNRLSMVNDTVREIYFEELHIEREKLQNGLVESFVGGKIGCLVGIAGQCLQKEHLPLFFREALNSRLLTAYHQSYSPSTPTEEWTFLAKRNSTKELILMAPGERWMKKGEVLKGSAPREERPSELIVEDVLQRLQISLGGNIYTALRVAVEWRYRPVKEIPVFWKTKLQFCGRRYQARWIICRTHRAPMAFPAAL